MRPAKGISCLMVLLWNFDLPARIRTSKRGNRMTNHPLLLKAWLSGNWSSVKDLWPIHESFRYATGIVVTSVEEKKKTGAGLVSVEVFKSLNACNTYGWVPNVQTAMNEVVQVDYDAVILKLIPLSIKISITGQYSYQENKREWSRGAGFTVEWSLVMLWRSGCAPWRR